MKFPMATIAVFSVAMAGGLASAGGALAQMAPAPATMQPIPNPPPAPPKHHGHKMKHKKMAAKTEAAPAK